MDTAEAAEKLGTTPRVLRQFLRSGHSTFAPVGSGARYDFTEKDLKTLERRFAAWNADGKPRPDNAKKPKTRSGAKSTKADRQRLRDEQEWAEEGPVTLEDIRDPRVRARVQADARAAEDRLMLRLMAAGLHITQLGDRKSA
jgi:DNA-binding transcriptional MerR regulator